jgi:hypothetical protein
MDMHDSEISQKLLTDNYEELLATLNRDCRLTVFRTAIRESYSQ